MNTKSRLILGCVLLAGLALPAACSRDKTFAYRTGRTYGYEVEMSSDSTVGSRAESKQFAFDLAGEMEVTPLERSEKRAKLILRFAQVKLSGSEDPAARERFERVARELQRPSVFTYQNGAVTEAALARNLEALTVGIMRNLAGALQAPAGLAGGSEVTVSEYDATGRYLAKYQPGDEPDTYRKRKLSYESLIMDSLLQSATFGKEVPAPEIVQSRAQLRITAGRLAELRAQERLELPLVAGSELSVQTATALTAIGDRPAVAVDRVALATDTERLAADAPYRSQSARFDFNSIKIGGRGFDELLSMLESLATRRSQLEPTDRKSTGEIDPDKQEEIKRWTGEQNRVLTAMATLLRTEPELTGRATAAIRAGSPAHRVLIAALGSAGAEASQRALLELMKDDDLSDDDRNAAGRALIRTKTPTDASARALQGLLDDRHWHQYAILGLGTYARLFRDAGRTGEHERLGRLLLARLRLSSSAGARADAFSALSNSGYAGMLDAVSEYFDHPDARTREHAVRAIRLTRHPEIERIAITKLEDAAPGVRRAALDIAERVEVTEQLAHAVRRVALDDQSANLRMSALRVLVGWKDRMPAVQTAIEQIAVKDASEPIRRVARQAVSPTG